MITIPESEIKRSNKDTKHILKPTCPFCGKVSDVIKHDKIGNKTYYKLSCGHTKISDKELVAVESNFFDTFISSDGKELYQYQKDGAKFGVDSNARCLIADEMGLGKTPQSLAVLKNLSLYPCLIVVKAGLKTQWEHESYRWIGTDKLVYVINEPRYEIPHPEVCPITIISYESLYRTKWHKDAAIMSQFKLMILDEVQQIKNRDAKRTDGIREAAKYIPHIVALSGTPVKNNAAEYFSILNILKPERFNDFNSFIRNYVDQYHSGGYVKYGGVQRHRIEAFSNATKDFIIRRGVEDVKLQLPPIIRDYKYYELGDKVKEAYIKLIEEFQEKYGDEKDMSDSILAYLNRMRYLTGMAKIEPTLEIVEDILENNPEDKVMIFCHHHDVLDIINRRLRLKFEKDGLAMPLNLMNTDNPSVMVEEFKKPENHVLIGTSLKHGEGLNIQFCQNFITVEREWNPANESQAEKRFSRIGSIHEVIKGRYPIALGTTDEFFAEIIEEKRTFMTSTLDGKHVSVSESSLLKELAETLMRKGKERWKM